MRRGGGGGGGAGTNLLSKVSSKSSVNNVNVCIVMMIRFRHFMKNTISTVIRRQVASKVC